VKVLHRFVWNSFMINDNAIIIWSCDGEQLFYLKTPLTSSCFCIKMLAIAASLQNSCSSVKLQPRLHDTTGYQTGWTTGLTTGWMFVCTMQPVVQPVWQPVGQPAVSCVQTFNRLSNPLNNRFDNRLYRVNAVWGRVKLTETDWLLTAKDKIQWLADL